MRDLDLVTIEPVDRLTLKPSPSGDVEGNRLNTCLCRFVGSSTRYRRSLSEGTFRCAASAAGCESYTVCVAQDSLLVGCAAVNMHVCTAIGMTHLQNQSVVTEL